MRHVAAVNRSCTIFKEIAMFKRKYVEILILFACGIALALALSGCRKKSEEAEPTKKQEKQVEESQVSTTAEPVSEADETPTPTVGTHPLQVIPLVGVWPVKFGMSEEDVIKHFGPPDKMEGRGIRLYYLASKGLSLLLDPRRGVWAIDCWSKQYPDAPPDLSTFAGKTKEGVAMGAGRKQIVAAYGEPDRTASKASLDTLYYDKLRIQFTLMQDSLVSIKLRASR